MADKIIHLNKTKTYNIDDALKDSLQLAKTMDALESIRKYAYELSDDQGFGNMIECVIRGMHDTAWRLHEAIDQMK